MVLALGRECCEPNLHLGNLSDPCQAVAHAALMRLSASQAIAGNPMCAFGGIVCGAE